jgi:uncharacterized protein YndB with AHSA1/START domain
MASVRKEVIINASPEEIWDALRDYGAVHKRVAPGFLLDCQLDGDARIVTFANGVVAREVLVAKDDIAMRLSYSATGGQLTHHNASAELFPDGGGTRFVWIADVLPHAAAEFVSSMMEDGIQAVKKTFEGVAVRTP